MRSNSRRNLETRAAQGDQRAIDQQARLGQRQALAQQEAGQRTGNGRSGEIRPGIEKKDTGDGRRLEGDVRRTSTDTPPRTERGVERELLQMTPAALKPLLREQMARAEKMGVQIKLTEGTGTFYRQSEKTMYLDRANLRQDSVQIPLIIHHELGHHMRSQAAPERARPADNESANDYARRKTVEEIQVTLDTIKLKWDIEARTGQKLGTMRLEHEFKSIYDDIKQNTPHLNHNELYVQATQVVQRDIIAGKTSFDFKEGKSFFTYYTEQHGKFFATDKQTRAGVIESPLPAGTTIAVDRQLQQILDRLPRNISDTVRTAVLDGEIIKGKDVKMSYADARQLAERWQMIRYDSTVSNGLVGQLRAMDSDTLRDLLQGKMTIHKLQQVLEAPSIRSSEMSALVPYAVGSLEPDIKKVRNGWDKMAQRLHGEDSQTIEHILNLSGKDIVKGLLGSKGFEAHSFGMREKRADERLSDSEVWTLLKATKSAEETRVVSYTMKRMESMLDADVWRKVQTLDAGVRWDLALGRIPPYELPKLFPADGEAIWQVVKARLPERVDDQQRAHMSWSERRDFDRTHGQWEKHIRKHRQEMNQTWNELMSNLEKNAPMSETRRHLLELQSDKTYHYALQSIKLCLVHAKNWEKHDAIFVRQAMHSLQMLLPIQDLYPTLKEVVKAPPRDPNVSESAGAHFANFAELVHLWGGRIDPLKNFNRGLDAVFHMPIYTEIENQLILGQSGRGKSTDIKNTLLQTVNDSVIVFDHKDRDLYMDSAGKLAKTHEVLLFSLSHPEDGLRINPLAWVPRFNSEGGEALKIAGQDLVKHAQAISDILGKEGYKNAYQDKDWYKNLGKLVVDIHANVSVGEYNIKAIEAFKGALEKNLPYLVKIAAGEDVKLLDEAKKSILSSLYNVRVNIGIKEIGERLDVRIQEINKILQDPALKSAYSGEKEYQKLEGLLKELTERVKSKGYEPEALEVIKQGFVANLGWLEGKVVGEEGQKSVRNLKEGIANNLDDAFFQIKQRELQKTIAKWFAESWVTYAMGEERLKLAETSNPGITARVQEIVTAAVIHLRQTKPDAPLEELGKLLRNATDLKNELWMSTSATANKIYVDHLADIDAKQMKTVLAPILDSLGRTLEDPTLRRLTSVNEIDLNYIMDNKVALFFDMDLQRNSENDMLPFLRTMQSMMTKVLTNEKARRLNAGLDMGNKINFIIDEAGVMGSNFQGVPFPNLANFEAYTRSSGIFFTIGTQDSLQMPPSLDTKATMKYLTGMTMQDAEKMEQSLGNRVVIRNDVIEAISNSEETTYGYNWHILSGEIIKRWQRGRTEGQQDRHRETVAPLLDRDKARSLVFGHALLAPTGKNPPIILKTINVGDKGETSNAYMHNLCQKYTMDKHQEKGLPRKQVEVYGQVWTESSYQPVDLTDMYRAGKILGLNVSSEGEKQNAFLTGYRELKDVQEQQVSLAVENLGTEGGTARSLYHPLLHALRDRERALVEALSIIVGGGLKLKEKIKELESA